MPTVSEIAVKYSARGAKQAQQADRDVRESIQTTADTARQETGTINRWMERHKSAIQSIGVATAAAMGGILAASPTFRAEMAGIRTAFSLLADTIVRDVLPSSGSLTGLAFDLVQGYRNLPDPIRNATSKLLLFGTAAITLVSAGTRLAGVVTTAAGALSGLIGIVKGAPAALTGLIAKIKGVGATIAGLVSGSLAAQGAIGGFIGTLGVGVLEVTGFLDAVENIGSAVGNRLPASVRDGMLAFSSFFLGPLAVVGGAVRGFVQGVLDDGLVAGINRAIEGAKTQLGIFADAWRNTLGRIWDFATDIASDIPDIASDIPIGISRSMRAGIPDIRGVASAFVEAILAPFEWLRNRLIGNSLIPDTFGSIPQIIRSVVPSVGQAASAIANAIRNAIPSPADLVSSAASAVGGVATGIRNRLPSVSGAAGSVADTITDAVPSPIDVFSSAQNAVTGIANGLGNNIGAVATAASNLAATITGALPTPQDMLSLGANLASNLKSGLQGALEGGVDAVTDMAQEGVNSATNFAQEGVDAAGGMIDAGVDAATGGGDIPFLQTGGTIEEGGLAAVHEGETVVPADVSRDLPMGPGASDSGGGGGGGMSETTVDITIQRGAIQMQTSPGEPGELDTSQLAEDIFEEADRRYGGTTTQL